MTEKINFYQKLLGQGRLSSSNKNYDVKCPFCNPIDSSKKKLSIRIEDDANHCWTCDHKARTLVPLLKQFGTRELLIEYRDKFMSSLSDATINEQKSLVSLPKDFTLINLANKSDPDVKSARFYLKKRGISEREAWKYKLGLSNEYRWHRRVIMPSFDAKGNINFFVGRSIDGNRRKYDNPDVKKNDIIFNEISIDWKQRLVICEGPFDLVKCGNNAVALLGSTLDENSLLFNKIVANNTPVAVALDADMWSTKMPTLVKKFEKYDIDVIVVDLREVGDPGNITKQEFQELLKQAKKMTWASSFQDRLERASFMSLTI